MNTRDAVGLPHRRALKGLMVVLASAVLVACGGSSEGDQTPRVSYGKIVSFGDSLSDVGTYAVGTIAGLGGGKYTINGETSQIWIERLADTLGLAAPCAAQTGMVGVEAAGIVDVPVTDAPECFAYAQGGARVTNPIGPGNALLGLENNGIGQLTDPVVNQIQRHLAKGEGFADDDLVLVLAGGNDVFMNLAAASTVGSDAVVAAMATAGTELAGYVKDQIVANGAKRVVVVNLPDVSLTPFAVGTEAAAPGTQALIAAMVSAYNGALSSGVAGLPEVLYVDAYTESQNNYNNPAQYALRNVTTPSCDRTKAVYGSLSCTADTLIGTANDLFLYADDVHPTPYGYQLLAQYVALNMAKVGWL